MIARRVPGQQAQSGTLCENQQGAWDRRLNLGCGQTFDPTWTNLDLDPVDPSVKRADLSRALPFPDASFDVVYHSHVLEHLDQPAGRYLIEECFRVLRPGGVLRVVVPDLEQIASLYLEMHAQAWSGDEQAAERYQWMKLELLDQLVRSKSGGGMGRYMAEVAEGEIAAFVRSRIGVEFQFSRASDRDSPGESSPTPALALPRFGGKRRTAGMSLQQKVICKLAEWLVGEHFAEEIRVAAFRSRGEIHRWMYDRFSLKSLCENAGFVSFQVCDPFRSTIPGFALYGLDTRDGIVRKPDSLFVECSRPGGEPDSTDGG